MSANQTSKAHMIPGVVSGLPIWIIYDRPRDHPGHCVARQWINDVPTDQVMIHTDINVLRAPLRAAGLCCLEREPQDDPAIVEVWL